MKTTKNDTFNYGDYNENVNISTHGHNYYSDDDVIIFAH